MQNTIISKINIFCCTLLPLLFCTSASAETIHKIYISAFATEQLKGWKSKQFKGQTNYQLVQTDNQTVLKAHSQASASGLFKQQRIDLQQTPYLYWRWRIGNHLTNLNEQEKSGDDFAARVYIVIDGGWAFWKTKAINYVWSSVTEKGKIWPNAYAGKNAMMFAIRSTEDPTGTWLQEKRNVQADLQKIYSKAIRYIDAVAVMTDTDNTQGQATAYYSNIYFSSH